MPPPDPIPCDATTIFPDMTGANVIVRCNRIVGHPEDEHGHVAQFEGEDDEGERWVTTISWSRKRG